MISRDQTITGVIIQHEYGIFGGDQGEHILEFMQRCTKPILVTLHTVLPHPAAKMKAVTEQIIELARTVVVLTETSKAIVEHLYPHCKDKVSIIPHGIHGTDFSDSESYKKKLLLENHIVLTTFGLLSRGKGIEYVLRALPEVIKKHPTVLYLVLGETHPVVRRNEGEAYRRELSELVTELQLQNHVRFYDQYFNLEDLFELLKATDIYISTSINPNQAVSGTLSYALGLGRAVISTEFAQARELVSRETGRLVPIEDSAAITAALQNLLDDKSVLPDMHRAAYEKTRPMVWDTVAQKYLELLSHTMVPQINMNHLLAMTDTFGMFQFAALNVPNKEFGYTLDDNARALIVCCWLAKSPGALDQSPMIATYLSFIDTCQSADGSFINYIGHADKSPTEQNNREDLQDAQSRALWALSEVMCTVQLPSALREEAKRMFLHKLANMPTLSHLRSRAIAIKAFALALPMVPDYAPQLTQLIHTYAEHLLLALKTHSIKAWQWFEGHLSYNNAILSEGLIIAGVCTGTARYLDRGLFSLDFLISKTFSQGMYLPIGHSNWYTNTEKRSEFDQQPEEPASMIMALTTAYSSTRKKRFKELAGICFSWFLGNNRLNSSLYNAAVGGCFDGLHPDRVNQNQGAESLVSYLMSNLKLHELENEHPKN